MTRHNTNRINDNKRKIELFGRQNVIVHFQRHILKVDCPRFVEVQGFGLCKLPASVPKYTTSDLASYQWHHLT